MAEDKDKKPVGVKLDPFEWLVVVIFLLGFVSTIVPSIFSYLGSGQITFYGIKIATLGSIFGSFVPILKILGYLIAGSAAILAFVYRKRSDSIWEEEKAKKYPDIMAIPSPDAKPAKNPLSEKWDKIVEHSESEDPSLWRLCIIEADIILEDLLRKLQLPGDTIGEKLKAVEKSDFNTIEYAWEAHKARNMIAHEGSDFQLNQRETRRIISLYEAVFKEFYLI